MSDQNQGGAQHTIDPQLPKRVLQTIRDEQPYQEHWSEDLKILLDPNIQARSLALPAIGTIKVKNHDYRYRWVRIKLGSNPDTSRYMQLKAVGFDNATTEDVEVTVADIVEGKNEIRSGDRILMRCPRAIYDGLMKQHMLDSIRQTSRARAGMYQELDPNRRMNTQDPTMMRSADFAPAPVSMSDLRGERTGTVDVEAVMNRSNPGNTSVVKQPARESGQAGRK